MVNNRRDFSNKLIQGSVLGEWFQPMITALDKVRFSDKKFSALPMSAFILFGCLRQIQSTASLRAQIQDLFHLDPQRSTPPLARSTWSDALASSQRGKTLTTALTYLIAYAQQTLPDRLAHIEGLGERPVIATDASYLHESAHYCPVYKKAGGNDNQKGHMMLSHYDLRKGIPLAATTQTRSIGEILVLKQDELAANAWLRVKNAIHVVDRAFIDGRYWDKRFEMFGSSVITRMKSILKYTVEKERSVALNQANKGVLSDREVTLKCSKRRWRLVGFRSPDGIEYEYLTNDLMLEPGVVAFLYYRRWDKEKYYDSFKNDLAGTKAWAKSPIAIEQQALMGIVTVVLMRLFLQRRQQDLQLEKMDGTQDRKHQIKQDIANRTSEANSYRASWTQLSKITRQAWRFLKSCFMQKHGLRLYQRQLRPLLLRYL